MRSKGTAGLLVCALVAAALAPARASLGSASAAPGANAPAAPAAARVSVLTGGTMTVTRENDRAGASATINTALLPGDAFATDGASTRAEIQLDGYTALRLAGAVRGRIAADDANARRIEISAGLAELSLWRGEEPDAEIVTPALTLRTHYAGSYRIAVAADGTTSVTARSGQAQAIVPEKTYALVAGKTLEARVWAGKVAVKIVPAIAADDFDAFNQTRDRVLAGALGDNAQLPASLAGYDDLTGYGSWANLATYGDVWVPQQSAGWAPYRDGNWDYDTGYGWTWVGAEPWGWVPYHYGRWFYLRRLGWCWYPPPVAVAPVWAPGLVAFFGYGFGPFGYPNYGWVPLAPYEPYYPWYPFARRNRLVPNPSQSVLTAYRNARDGGASALGAQAWSAGAVSRPGAVDPAHLASAKFVEGRLPLAPFHAQTPAAPAPAAPAQAAHAAPWAEEFTRAAKILDDAIPSLPHGSVPELHLLAVPGARAAPPAAHAAPSAVHQATPGEHQAPPEMRHGPPAPPIMRFDPPVSTRSEGSRPPA